MTKALDNPCVNCGKQRKVLKTWKEEIKTFTGRIQIVTYSETICPNPECQEIVDKAIKAQKLNAELLRKKKEESKLLRQHINKPSLAS